MATDTTAQPPEQPNAAGAHRVVLIGNPNVGKSTLFGRLARTRVHTANFPGTTQSATVAKAGSTELIDLPGVYSLDATPGNQESESALCRDALSGTVPGRHDKAPPDAAIVVLDAANLSRNLRLAAEVIETGTPTLIVLNRIDQADKRGTRIDTATLAEATGCTVLTTNGLTGQGVDAILPALRRTTEPGTAPHGTTPQRWAESVVERCVSPGRGKPASDTAADRLDAVFLHPLLGTAVFAVTMTALFWAVFKLATHPMDWIDAGFGSLAAAASAALPEGDLASLLADGIIGGVGATVIFLPQICLMFFLITLLEQSGYLPRAALLIDRLLRPFGLPGQSFVPLLTSHACALPGIIACRSIPNRRERLATILVAPFMSCTARIPVYVLLTSLLFADRPALAAIAFTGCYALGAAAALLTAVLFRQTILRGPSRSMAIELPGYRLPSLRHAIAATADRAWLFLRKAGTVILAIVVALWWLSNYPHTNPSPQAAELRQQAAQLSDPDASAALLGQAERVENRHAAANTFMGIAGRAAEPVFRPLGYDWQLTVGVLSSFAAREVFVSTMAVVTAAGDEDAAESETGLERIASAKRDDGATPVFTRPTAWSLLVFYVLAMQCLPTLAVTARESGSWRWAALQLAYMTAVAYAGGLIAYTVTGML